MENTKTRGNIKDSCTKTRGNIKDINIKDFQKYFLVAYGCTTHSAQGISIGEPYTIHEWDRMDQRLKYVALSRSRDYS